MVYLHICKSGLGYVLKNDILCFQRTQFLMDIVVTILSIRNCNKKWLQGKCYQMWPKSAAKNARIMQDLKVPFSMHTISCSIEYP